MQIDQLRLEIKKFDVELLNFKLELKKKLTIKQQKQILKH